MKLEVFLSLADEYVRMGGSVQEQLKAVVLDGEDMEDQNPNALRYVETFLRDAARDEIDDAAEWAADIADYLKAGVEA